MEKTIQVIELTKSYGVGKGVFNLSFDVNQGEVFGFLGPNGAGKTTTIRHLMGFIHPDQGQTMIMGIDPECDAPTILKDLGYLPGEISFFDHMTGRAFLRMLAELRGLESLEKMEYLIQFFELDDSSKIRKMSKGMKQKLGLVAAFMHDPKILILDEPTSGLDPLMQTQFVELIMQEKKVGKTILMSSHSFEEIERTCDRAAIIRNGELVALEDIKQLKKEQRKIYLIRFKKTADVKRFIAEKVTIHHHHHLNVEVVIEGDINPLIKLLSNYDIESVDVKAQSLEEIFMRYYKKEAHHE